jgi:signal transduction histidine kinase
VSGSIYREALGDTADEYDVLLTHLSVIRDVVELAHSAGSFEDLCATLAARVVAGLGYERASVLAVCDDGEPKVLGSASQGQRLAGEIAGASPILRALAQDVMEAHRLLRWSDDGVGARRPVPAGLEGGLVGWPLVVGGECVGAVLCEELVTTPWNLARQRALELVGEIIDQVVTLAEVRLSMTAMQRRLEHELGTSRSLLSNQAETLHAQAERIDGLTSSLVTSNQAKNHFLGLMSHELRTPLSVILGFGSILHDGLAGPVTKEQEEHLDRVLSNGRHLNQLIDDMLFFVDAETTRIAPQWSRVDLAALVGEVAESLPEIARADAPALTVSIAPEAAVVCTDQGLLRRVLFHLLGNACKFAERGTVHVQAMRAADASATEIRITDTGIGIPAEQLRRIFDLFQQGDDTHARKREGIGLGLNLVQACLVILRGRCRLVAMPAGGTRVELWIPERGAARASGDVGAGATASFANAAELALSEAALVGVACDGAEVIALARRATDGVQATEEVAPVALRAAPKRL